MNVSWTQAETDLLVEMWNGGATYKEMQATFTNHCTYEAIKQRVVRLRQLGMPLPSRKVGMPPEEARRLRLKRAKAWRDRHQEIALALDGWPPAGTKLFADAKVETGFVTKIIPAPSNAASPIVSSATWAVV